MVLHKIQSWIIETDVFLSPQAEGSTVTHNHFIWNNWVTPEKSIRPPHMRKSLWVNLDGVELLDLPRYLPKKKPAWGVVEQTCQTIKVEHGPVFGLP